MVSLAQGNTLRKSAFSSKIIVKDYVVAAYLSDRLFLAFGHILIKISSKDFLRSNFQNNSVDNFRRSVSSVCSVDKIPMIRALRG